MATLAYEELQGHFPGYMNARKTEDGRPYADPNSEIALPVSWVVEVLTHVDADRLYDGPPTATPTATATATPTATPSPTPDAQFPKPIEAKRYIEILVCPSWPGRKREGPLLTYAVNSGMPDLPQATPPRDGTPGLPRDWPANGVFFDRYSDSPMLRGTDPSPTPMVSMRRSTIVDPKDKTVILSENLDVGLYAFDRKDFPNGDPFESEQPWGIVWAPGHIEAAAPKMIPPATVLPINRDLQPRRRQEYRHSRPSSLHPQGVNVAFVGTNVVFVRDTMSYFVWAKLMASDDANTKMPGSLEPLDARFRNYQLNDADLNP